MDGNELPANMELAEEAKPGWTKNKTTRTKNEQMDKNKTKRSLMRCCRNPELTKEGGNIEDGSVVVTNDIEIHDLMLLLPLACMV